MKHTSAEGTGYLAGNLADEPPPIAGSWSRLYALVVFVLIADVAIFYIVGEVFS